MNNSSSVSLYARAEDSDMVSGKFPPQRIRNEPTDSVNIVIRSEDRHHGTDFNFSIDLLTSSVNLRKIQLAKIMLPLLPQINENNKTIRVTHFTGNVTFDLIPGYYSVQALVNMMQQQFTTAWLSLNPINLVTVNYNIDTRTISVTDDNAQLWYFNTGFPFDLFGRNVVKFPTLPTGSPLATNVTTSTSLGMIYSRYITLTSNRLTEDQKSFSIISNLGPQNIVGVLDLTSQYGATQFSATSSFPGTDVVIDCLAYSPRINILNRNKALKVIDFMLLDEFGIPVDRINTVEYPFIYPVAMWFQCST